MELNIQLEDYLKRFRVFHSTSLFPPDFNLLKQMKCPICARKLYFNRDQSKAFCKSKQKDKFFITRNTLSRIGVV